MFKNDTIWTGLGFAHLTTLASLKVKRRKTNSYIFYHAREVLINDIEFRRRIMKTTDSEISVTTQEQQPLVGSMGSMLESIDYKKPEQSTEEQRYSDLQTGLQDEMDRLSQVATNESLDLDEEGLRSWCLSNISSTYQNKLDLRLVRGVLTSACYQKKIEAVYEFDDSVLEGSSNNSCEMSKEAYLDGLTTKNQKLLEELESAQEALCAAWVAQEKLAKHRDSIEDAEAEYNVRVEAARESIKLKNYLSEKRESPDKLEIKDTIAAVVSASSGFALYIFGVLFTLSFCSGGLPPTVPLWLSLLTVAAGLACILAGAALAVGVLLIPSRVLIMGFIKQKKALNNLVNNKGAEIKSIQQEMIAADEFELSSAQEKYESALQALEGVLPKIADKAKYQPPKVKLGMFEPPGDVQDEGYDIVSYNGDTVGADLKFGAGIPSAPSYQV